MMAIARNAQSQETVAHPFARLFERALGRPVVSRLFPQLAVAAILIAAATLLRIGFGLLDSRITPFSLYFPVILLAALLGGWRAGLTAVALAVAISWGVFLGPSADFRITSPIALANIALFAAAAATIVAVSVRVNRLIEKLDKSQAALAARNLHYDLLFDTMSEGFAVCEAIRDESGRLVDYVVLEMNVALQKMLGVGPEAVGGRLSDAGGDQTAWLRLCDRVLKTGRPQVFEYHNRQTGRWHEIHLTPITSAQMGQLFFDITDRKSAQTRQADLFDELNHRVKNNLTIVSAFLSMQARGRDSFIKSELLKAVDRVRSIADIHEILYTGRHDGDVDFASYLERLCQRLSASLLGDDRIEIIVNAQPLIVSADHAVPLGMIVNELVTNAVKYAYPPPERGAVTVDLSATASGALLSVADRGRGLPQDFGGSSDGLGAKLLHSMIKQVGGDLRVRGPPGAAFDIELPNRVITPMDQGNGSASDASPPDGA